MANFWSARYLPYWVLLDSLDDDGSYYRWRKVEAIEAYVCVNEFLKEGLPDAHCIFILSESSKAALSRTKEVNFIISVKNPSSNK